MHASRGRGQPRVLYWFRTPPNVRVGRPALDEDAIRAIEACNPDLTFDWPHMLKTQPPPARAPAERPGGGRERRGRDRDASARGGGRTKRGERQPALEPRAAGPAVPAETEMTPAPADEAVAAAEAMLAADAEADIGVEPGVEGERPALPPGLHVAERLGPEGFSLLRARYAELMARIAERVTDPARLEQLRGQAERLNPDTWITDEEARAGIEGFDTAYEAIRAQLGRRRRRSRRGGVRRRRARLARATGPAGDAGVDAAPAPPGEDAGAADDGEDGEPGDAD